MLLFLYMCDFFYVRLTLQYKPSSRLLYQRGMSSALLERRPWTVEEKIKALFRIIPFIEYYELCCTEDTTILIVRVSLLCFLFYSYQFRFRSVTDRIAKITGAETTNCEFNKIQCSCLCDTCHQVVCEAFIFPIAMCLTIGKLDRTYKGCVLPMRLRSAGECFAISSEYTSIRRERVVLTSVTSRIKI